MIKKIKRTMGVAAGLMLSFSSYAVQTTFTFDDPETGITITQIISDDDIIVQGKQCTGRDCLNSVLIPEDDPGPDAGTRVGGETFGNDVIRLKGNNTRIRFHDTSAADVLGQSWNINANGFRNNGRSYFGIGAKSLLKDSTPVSDGTFPKIQCPHVDPLSNIPVVIGVLPLGEPEVRVTQVLPLALPFTYECTEVSTLTHTEKPVLQIGEAGTDFIKIGDGSAVVDNAVSVGHPDLLRKLVNIAEGLNETDALIKKTLDEYTVVVDQIDNVSQINQLLDNIEASLAVVDSRINRIENPPSSGSMNVFFLMLFSGLMFVRAGGRRFLDK